MSGSCQCFEALKVLEWVQLARKGNVLQGGPEEAKNFAFAPKIGYNIKSKGKRPGIAGGC